MRMTVRRTLLLVAVAVLLLSTGLGNAMRLQKLHHRPLRAPVWSGEPAPIDTDRLALVIGNSNYPDADFPIPQMTRDAEGLANALRKDGFLVEAASNATRSDITRAVDHLMARVQSNSIVLVYFGGHGVQSDGQNYFVPVDAKIWTEDDVRREGVSIDLLLSKLKTSGARVRLVIIEASRRNPYERRFRAYSHGLAPVQTTENTLILSSAAPDQVVEDSDEPHSQLMTTVLAQLNSSKEIEEFFKNIRSAVAAKTLG